MTDRQLLRFEAALVASVCGCPVRIEVTVDVSDEPDLAPVVRSMLAAGLALPPGTRALQHIEVRRVSEETV